MTVEEYLGTSKKNWFLTGKKEYTVQGMMVSEETSFHNELEDVDYTVTDDGTTVILKGAGGEMWTSQISNVIAHYTKSDGSELSEADFVKKDVFIELVTIPYPDSNYAMFVPKPVSVTVETAKGNVLRTNLPGAEHGEGDYLICKAGEDGEPDISDLWVVNGALFPENYDTTHAEME